MRKLGFQRKITRLKSCLDNKMQALGNKFGAHADQKGRNAIQTKITFVLGLEKGHI